MESITNFLENKLKLKVNREKSAVDRPWRRKFPGFSFYIHKSGIGIRVYSKAVKRFKDKVRGITSRSNGKSMDYRIEKLRQLITGWFNYFGIADMKGLARDPNKWIRRKIRMCFWKQWKKIKTKHDNLVKLGMKDNGAWKYANTRKGYWRISNSQIQDPYKWISREIRPCKSYTEVFLITLIPNEPPYTEQYVRWCERTINELIITSYSINLVFSEGKLRGVQKIIGNQIYLYQVIICPKNG